MLQEILSTQNINGIIALTALVSAIITATVSSVMNLISQYMSHKHELKMRYWEQYYTECTQTFKALLESSGKLLANPHNDNELLNVMAYLYQSYVYADEDLTAILNAFYTKLETWNNDIKNIGLRDDCQTYVPLVARDINRVLAKYSSIPGKCTRWYTKLKQWSQI